MQVPARLPDRHRCTLLFALRLRLDPRVPINDRAHLTGLDLSAARNRGAVSKHRVIVQKWVRHRDGKQLVVAVKRSTSKDSTLGGGQPEREQESDVFER